MVDCKNQNDEIHPPHWYGARHTQIILLFLLVAISYGISVSLSVGIVAMTDPKASPNPEVPAYDWDDQSVILSAFFVGYVIPQVAAGQLVKSYGPKWFLVVMSVIGSFLMILTPFLASLGSWAVILCRVLEGITQGFVYPSVHNLLSKWVPPLERARMGSFVYAGGPFGTVVAMSVTGWLSGTWVGWPYAFYIYGSLGLLWTAMWMLFGRNTPDDHNSIDLREKLYISQSLGPSQYTTPPATPWKAILTSWPVWAIIIAQSAHSWVFTTLFTTAPSYMGGVLGFDIKSNGLLSGAPYLVLWLMSFVFSALIDYAIAHKYLQTGAARKTANTIGFVVPAAALLVLGLINNFEMDSVDVSVMLLLVAIGINASAYCGYHVNHMDLSPIHSGTLMGIANSISNTFAIFAPVVQQFIVTDQHNSQQWAVIFYISSAVYIFGDAIFVLFGSGELQVWNESNLLKRGNV